jgi:hypothetical protein
MIGKLNDRHNRTDVLNISNSRAAFYSLTDDTALIRQQLEATGEAAAALETELAARLLKGDLP